MSSDQRQPPNQDDTINTRQRSEESVSTHPLAEELIQWYTHQGGWLSPDVHILFSHARGFHMQALRPLSSPNVASCPLRLTLSCLNLDPTQKELIPVTSPLQQCRGKIPDHILTYLLLIEQRKKGKESPWYAYIACLPGPESMTTPLWFDEHDVSFLAGTSLAPATKERKADMHKQWEQAVGVMREVGIATADEIHLDLLLWAATIFTSRAFISTHILPDQETIPILFPVVDILNHSVSAKVEWDFQPHRSFTLKCLDGATFGPGEELFNNYAPKQNDELLLGYGFCLADNPIEQFALKLAFPPMLQEYAQEMGLLDPKNVPFGMSTSFLTTDPNKEQHFLRAKDHPFGRYDNHIPFFRGIPPYIVHFFFIQCMLALDIDVQSINIERPGARITLQVLTLLHQAISQRCATLPLTIDLEPKTDKQRYAKIYRDGQAKIIHSIRLELSAVINNLRSPDQPRLLSPVNALAALQSSFPTHASQFTAGLSEHDLSGPEDEGLIWALLLTTFLALALATPPPAQDTSSPSFIHALMATYPLPALEDGIEDAETYTFIDENLSSFLRLPSPAQASASDESPTDMLDDLGLTFLNQPVDNTAPVFIQGKTENLGVRVVMWAMGVVDRAVVSVLEDGGLKKCLFVEEGSGEEWMYNDVDVSGDGML
ncbi:SET domain-containing protein [Dothidotthia symphoricarpi CBS 119687]|uniref:SET domain-containing protein n=1 Tax=Dothidotthia symphoricarpi CBS 119687 TaxID=1392245 RepID=A0A6A6AJ28_9PLEO|nr:SET domain-containing protein [Dothidotthia symphoricarpi CBS 119687]KAF2130441.1 SET domain-containing protein [Dothidotthia symphoricarpi CBS 119687]